MRDKERIKRILNLIEEYWNKNSDQRFGQMLINLNLAEDTVRLWNNEDEGLEEYLMARVRGNSQTEDKAAGDSLKCGLGLLENGGVN